ncbi:ABC transporter substrate-binding protein [Devosia aquimaris]|uniref:ABC transporter substrate-binding protein n=1 Tax=Devosia aquimaris TaxID=2866214 RepID=UPI001CD10BF6|nr:ABC transporter substrate-binding protein [Devosia sp. CJK-A8-3]
MIKFLFAGVLLLAAGSVVAQETQSFTDDLGRQVAVPVAPQRIAALHDIELTVPLLELGAPVIASHARPGADGAQTIRSSLLLTGQDLAPGQIADLGNNPIDIEALAALEPDLIITTVWQKAPVEQLELIAPTIVIDTQSGVRDDYALYDLLAGITGTGDRLATLKARYQAQIEQLRRVADVNRTVSTFHAQNGKLSVWNPYGAFGKILLDAGFSFPPVIADMAAGTSEQLSAEVLPELDADVIFVSYRGDEGQTPADAHAELETTLPGYCAQLVACQQGRMVLLPREEGWATSYTGLTMVAYAITTALGSLDFRSFN